ncbi:hypothetical protein N7510_003869 [Penicillium lagena]|uniref:uncharacterized protein n=1 Tax=Penicillium lagena TaxID=94218 RepID=UPI002540D1BC|nr:uncharacterized protein N7510_003869 [Penicillium lagena]KAJ5619885.1 hypothetical protein N7510_003869 [Penicillium lagena]
MFPGDSSSQYPSSQNRNPTEDLSKDHPLSPPAVAYPPTLIDSTSPVFQQELQIPGSSWPVNRPVPAVQGGGSVSSRSLPASIHPQRSTSSLNSSTSSSLLGLDSSLSAQLSLDSSHPAREQQLSSVETPRDGLGITYPMAVASDPYFSGPMQPNPQNYMWANRPFQPLQPPSGHMNQHFPHPQSYPSNGFSVGGYNGHPNGAMHSYPPPQDSQGASYLAASPGYAGRQNQSRSSPAVARPFHAHSTHSAPGTPPLSEQPMMTSSSPYMINQPAYYLPDAPSIPSSHPSMPVSSQPPSLVSNESLYSSPDSVPPASEPEHQVRVISSRPRPQCWDHGCNGREFSTFSNLLRHQREKSGVVAKAECPICGAVFTRTTARNIHVAQGKCKSGGRESSTE